MKTIGIFFTGAAVGVASALLYAPNRGARTRRELRKFTTQKLHQLQDLSDQLSDCVEEYGSDLKESVNACVSETRRRVDSAGQSVKKAIGVQRCVS